MTPNDVLKFAEENECQMVDFKFLDFIGIWQHFSAPIDQFSEDTFEEGIGFDGSSIRGWQPIHNSDMLLIPDPETAKIDPFIKVTTLSLICDIMDPITREGYSRDPRFIAKKAEAYLKSTGIADTAYLALKLSFLFLMMSVMLQLLMNHFTQWILLKEPGTPGGRNSRILVTSRATKKVTSLAPQLILTLISATKSYKCYKVSALLLRWSIMKFQPVVKMKLASDLILS